VEETVGDQEDVREETVVAVQVGDFKAALAVLIVERKEAAVGVAEETVGDQEDVRAVTVIAVAQVGDRKAVLIAEEGEEDHGVEVTYL
jgi:hypothetical protein